MCEFERASGPRDRGAGNAMSWWLALLVCAVGIILLSSTVAILSQRRIESDRRTTGDERTVMDAADAPTVHSEFGRQLFLQNCSTCHGADGAGMPRQGANLRDSVFVARRSDAHLLSFLRVGRAPGDRDSVLGLTMPPRGGNPGLEDQELADIVAYLRLVQHMSARRNDLSQSNAE